MNQQNEEFDPRQTQTITRFDWRIWAGKYAIYIVAVLLLAVAGYEYRQEEIQGRATAVAQNDLKLVNETYAKKAAELAAKVKAEDEAKAKAAEVAKKLAEEARIKAATVPTIGNTFAVVTGTIYGLNQREVAAAKSVGAFDACKYNGQSLVLCFVEVDRKTTEVIAVPKTPMTELDAIVLATCFNNSLPKLDSGEKVGAYASSLSLKRYIGKVCLTQ
jgi:hypothetical protein